MHTHMHVLIHTYISVVNILREHIEFFKNTSQLMLCRKLAAAYSDNLRHIEYVQRGKLKVIK
jgi:hypothetical protein